MFSDPQKQQLVYDLFLETIHQNLRMTKSISDSHGNIKDDAIKVFQDDYDKCVKIVELLKL